MVRTIYVDDLAQIDYVEALQKVGNLCTTASPLY